MLASKRVRVATRAWWRAGWQWWSLQRRRRWREPRAVQRQPASASKLKLLVKAMRLVSCRHIVEAVVLNIAVVVASRGSLAASNRRSLAQPTTITTYYIAKSNVLLDFDSSIHTQWSRLRQNLVSPVKFQERRCRLCFLLFTRKKLNKISAVLDLKEQRLFVWGVRSRCCCFLCRY